MENKIPIALLVIALAAVLSFLAASITGMVVHKTEYEDICRSDSDCPANQCCLIYEEKGIGLCMERCQSIEFLCKDSSECEEGLTCCLSEGMEYGICNLPEKCQSIDLFAEYVEKRPAIESPESTDVTGRILVLMAVLIAILIAAGIWLIWRKEKKR